VILRLPDAISGADTDGATLNAYDRIAHTRNVKIGGNPISCYGMDEPFKRLSAVRSLGDEIDCFSAPALASNHL
jgi:hypothetical protein